MAKSSSIKATDLGDAITQELTLYRQDVTDQVDKLSEETVKQLVKLTRMTAPVGERGDYRKSIASKCLVKRKTGSTYVWYAKAPNHRLTHLLVHGHATKDGGRTKANPFLKNALDQVLPEYEAAIERTLKNGK